MKVKYGYYFASAILSKKYSPVFQTFARSFSHEIKLIHSADQINTPTDENVIFVTTQEEWRQCKNWHVSSRLIPFAPTVLTHQKISSCYHQRPHILSVALVGPESTGKSTLAHALAQKCQTVWVPEYARIYADIKPSPLESEDVLPIAFGHQSLFEALKGCTAEDFLICDTDSIMTALYADIYYQNIPPELTKLTKEWTHDLYILLTPNVPWVQDHQRDLPTRREIFAQDYQQYLQDLGRTVIIIDEESWEKRTEAALSTLTQFCLFNKLSPKFSRSSQD